MSTPAQRLRLFAEFCRCTANDHPYLGEGQDAEQAQEACASDIEAVLGAIESLLPMAREHAEAGGSGGPEMRDYRAVEEILES